MLIVINLVQSIPQRYRHKWIYDNGEFDLISGNFSVTQSFLKNSVYPSVKEKTFQQLVNHFDAHETKTFNQRYFVDETYWSKTITSPVFLCVGGEGPPLDKVYFSVTHLVINLIIFKFLFYVVGFSFKRALQ